MLHEVRRAGWSSPMYLPDIDGDAFREAGFTLAALGWLYSDGSFLYEQVCEAIAVHVVQAGHGIFSVGGTDYKAGPGDMFTFFPGNHYRYFDSPDAPMRYGWFRMTGRLAVDVLASAGIMQSSPLVQGEFADAIEPLLREAAEVYAAPSTPPLYPQAAAWRLADAIQRASVPRQVERSVPMAEAARALMEEHLMSGVTVDEVAGKLGITRSTLFRKFRERYSVSPKEYLDSVRIERARRLLVQSTAPVKEIAALCGYEDSHYFSRTFKRQVGLTPSEVRATSGRT